MVAAISRNVRPDRPRAADALDLALLDRAQQLGLQVEPQIADLVEEQRAAVGQLELADALLQRAGERALLVAEQRALDQLARNRGEVDGDERRRRAFADSRCSSRASSSLPVPLSPRISTVADSFATLCTRLEHVLERGARAGDELAVAGIARRILQRQHVAVEVLALAGVRAPASRSTSGSASLREEVIGAELDRLHRAVDVGRRGES